MTATSLFRRGFTDLISVIPPDAQLAPSSTIKPDDRGKAPGVLYPSGWGGYGWRNAVPTIEDAMRFDESRANIGLAASRFPAIDIDVLDPMLATAISDVIDELIPTGPVRVGLYPKKLLVFRLAHDAEPFTRMQLVMDYNGRQLVEILGAGQQYVISGVHSKTKKHYEWPVELPLSASELPTLTRDMADQILRAIELLVCEPLGIECYRAGSGDTRVPGPQEDLVAHDLDEFEAALALIPNDEEHFPTRADYIAMGFAVKAATASDSERGYAAFEKWALEWPANTPEQVRKDWDSFEGPFEIGAEYVFERARAHGFEGAPAEFKDGEDVPPEPKETKAKTPFSDMWMTDLLVERYGEHMAFQPERGKWMAYQTGIWNEDLNSRIPGNARQVCVEVANKVLVRGATDKEKRESESLAKSLSSSRQLQAMITLAKQDSRVIVTQDKFDVSPVLLGTPAGVVNLETGDIMEPRPDLYISKSTPVSPGPPSDIWQRFLEDATNGDVELQKYLQRMSGYCLTGYTIENILFFVWGEGGRGKSTFVDTISAVLGGYAKTAPMATFTAKKQERHPTELAMLAGSRLVTAQEVNEGSYWDEQRIKALTGGDAVTARFLNQDNFTYVPTFKLLFSGNARPKIANADAAMKRRIHLISFNHPPKKIDQRLKERLKNEALPGVLSWMIEGALEWKRIGLAPPTVVIDATNEYLASEDPEGRWLTAKTLPEGQATVAELFASWTDYADKHGEPVGTQRKFVNFLTNRGYKRGKEVDGHMTFVGVCLKEKKQIVPGEEFPAEEKVMVN